MITAPPTPVLVAPAEAVESLLRSEQATIAKLTLRLRDLVHEVETAAAETSQVDHHEAREVLRQSLDELVERRRRELEEMLDGVRSEARTVVESARVDAAAIARDLERATAPQPRPELSPPPRLRVVDLRDLEPVQLAAAVPVEVPEVVRETHRDATPAAGDVTRNPDPPELTAEHLAPVVEAAVAAALGGVAAMAGLLSANVVPPSAAVPAAVVVDRAPTWRRFLYADVILPLVAVLIVVIIVFAWAG